MEKRKMINSEMQQLDEKLAKLKKERKELIKQKKERQKREDAERQLLNGRLVERYFNHNGISSEILERILQALMENVTAFNIIDNWLTQSNSGEYGTSTTLTPTQETHANVVLENQGE